jgi:hypothetical protein
MTRKHEMIGFSQRIRLDWLQHTADLALAGSSKDEIFAALRERLRDRLSVGRDPERGNREKAITILAKVWVTVPHELRSLRDDGLGLLQRLPAGDRMLVHWCMCIAVYPFFGAVAEATGRLLHLQRTASAPQVQRRVREQFGERETVSRAARRILRAFVDWGVLAEAGKTGIYRGESKRVADEESLILWVLKAALLAKAEQSLSLPAALRGPRLFPFDIVLPPIRALEGCRSIEITRHGLDQEILLGLRNTAPA